MAYDVSTQIMDFYTKGERFHTCMLDKFNVDNTTLPTYSHYFE
jgi:hypothetical protein